MSTQENFIESLIELINQHFHLQVVLDEENVPVVTEAREKQSNSLTQFFNGCIQLVENADTTGIMNVYFEHELDYDTPEEMHRY